MKIILESTTKIVEVNGIQCRVWEGKTEAGVPMHAYIIRVAVDRHGNAEEFERDLLECREPSTAVRAMPSRFVL